MKLRQSQFLLIILLTAAAGASSQDLPKRKLISEFGLLPCEHVHAQTDSFPEEIKEDPVSRAVILIYPPTVRPEQAQRHRRQISSFLQNRGLSADRFSFYKGGKSPDGEIRTEFWKLGPGAELPFTDAPPWPEEAPDTSRAFIFGYVYEINICQTFVPRAFARLILENPGSRGHVVIEVGKDAMINKFWFAEQWIKDLVESHGVPRKRLRLYFTKGKDATAAEFWFVPARKK
jgi:hypothetical protein